MRYAELLTEEGFKKTSPVVTESNRAALRAATERYIAEHGPELVGELGDYLRHCFEIELRDSLRLFDDGFTGQGPLRTIRLYEAIGRVYPCATRIVKTPVRLPVDSVDIMGDGWGNVIMYTNEHRLDEWIRARTRRNEVVEVDFNQFPLTNPGQTQVR